MLRRLTVLVLLANAAFFAWSQGWLSPWFAAPLIGERDPARLAAQQRPELVQLLSPKAASAALLSARAASAAGDGEACVQIGPLNDSDATDTEARLVASGVPREAWERREVSGEPGRSVLRLERASAALRDQLRAGRFDALPCRVN